MHYVVTQILRYYHAVPNCASLGAHVLRFQTCLHQLPSLPSIQESCDRNCRKLLTTPSLVKSLLSHVVFRSTSFAAILNEANH
ncbi:hypothetical protein T4A_8065 [Trichinella pseudospiralis]|uniref:Uncharacterized protein n=1 Tax=Trichinella pseudospiralis TaxID=6337 RepID=A0A0V1ES46_TRIPS|nr:hypothetical protein T4A_8065 [Trichinella pseudospiralis]